MIVAPATFNTVNKRASGIMDTFAVGLLCELMGRSQSVLAGLVGRSESWLSQVERGLRSVDSHSVLVQLAEVPGVEFGQLTPSETRAETVKYEPVPGIGRGLRPRAGVGYRSEPLVLRLSASIG